MMGLLSSGARPKGHGTHKNKANKNGFVPAFGPIPFFRANEVGP